MAELLERMASDMKRLKAYFPYRHVWGAISPDGTRQETGANLTRRQMNDKHRQGWRIYTLDNT